MISIPSSVLPWNYCRLFRWNTLKYSVSFCRMTLLLHPLQEISVKTGFTVLLMASALNSFGFLTFSRNFQNNWFGGKLSKSLFRTPLRQWEDWKRRSSKQFFRCWKNRQGIRITYNMRVCCIWAIIIFLFF